MNKHIIILENRNYTSISGVKKADCFTSEEIAVYTEEGDLLIKGCELVIEEFKEDKGELKINGRINSLSYRSEKQHIPDNFLSRLFR